MATWFVTTMACAQLDTQTAQLVLFGLPDPSNKYWFVGL
jgi:hypothetical protein